MVDAAHVNRCVAVASAQAFWRCRWRLPRLQRKMRRPRRRLVYTTGLRDPGIPSGVPPDCFLKCDDDFEVPGATPTCVAEPSCTSHSQDANPRSDLSRETSALRQIRWEVQQIELEANYSRILQDLSTSRAVLEELVDQVVATCHGANPHDSNSAAAKEVASRGRLAPRESSQSSRYSTKEITSERKFATCHVKERVPRASTEHAGAGGILLSALERVKKIRDTLAGPYIPASQSALSAAAASGLPAAEWHNIHRDRMGETSQDEMASEPAANRPMSENLALQPLGAFREAVRFSSLEGLYSSRPSEAKNSRDEGGGLDLSDLHESLWGTLPFDLVERILARLPLPCLLSCRAVCRKWNRTLDDRGFLAVYSGIPPQKPWLFTWDSWIEDDSHAYNPKLDRWYKIPLRFIPHEHVKRPLHIVGAVDGLLFFEYFARLYIALCVCNPVTKAWRKLPPLNEKRVQPVVAVFEDRERRGEFTVVVAGGLSKPSVMHKVYSTEIFESKTNCWRKTCDKITEDGGHIRWGPYVRTAFCNGNLYYMLWRFKLLTYNMGSGTWSHVTAPSPPALDPESGISPFLVESKGRLLMIGFHDNESHLPQDGLVIWELNAAANNWVEIARMPEKFFASMQLRKIQGVGCADLIYIFESFSAPVVICDISKHTPEWRQIDNGSIRGNNRVIYGCTTDLRLDASVT